MKDVAKAASFFVLFCSCSFKLAVRCLNAEAVVYDAEADEAMHWSR